MKSVNDTLVTEYICIFNSDDSIYRKYPYIVFDTYIVSYRWNKYRLFQYIAIFQKYRDICYRFFTAQREWKKRLQKQQVNGVI